MGVVTGAVVMTVAGSWALGWTLGSSAERMAGDRADIAVVDALTPVCIARFEAPADAAAKLTEFKKTSTSWEQQSFIEKDGWATAPGNAASNSDVATACAAELGKAT